MNTKIVGIILAVLLLATAASATTSFGTYTSEESKTVDDLSATYEIKLINLGDRPLETSLLIPDKEELTILHDEQITVPAQEPTENPSNYELEDDEEWFLLGDKYVRAKIVPINVGIHESRSQNSFEFDTRVEAVAEIETSSGGDDEEISPTQEIVYQQDYTFRIRTTESIPSEQDLNPIQNPEPPEESQESQGSLLPSIETNNNPFTDQESGEDQEGEFNIDEEEQQEEDSSTEPDISGYDESDFDEGDSTTQQDAFITGDFIASAGAGYSTLILLLGVVASTLYLFRVI